MQRMGANNVANMVCKVIQLNPVKAHKSGSILPTKSCQKSCRVGGMYINSSN